MTFFASRFSLFELLPLQFPALCLFVPFTPRVGPLWPKPCASRPGLAPGGFLVDAASFLHPFLISSPSDVPFYSHLRFWRHFVQCRLMHLSPPSHIPSPTPAPAPYIHGPFVVIQPYTFVLFLQ